MFLKPTVNKFLCCTCRKAWGGGRNPKASFNLPCPPLLGVESRDPDSQAESFSSTRHSWSWPGRMGRGPKCTQIRGQNSELKRQMVGLHKAGQARQPSHPQAGSPDPQLLPKPPKLNLAELLGVRQLWTPKACDVFYPPSPFPAFRGSFGHNLPAGKVIHCEYSVIFHKLTELCNCHHSPVLDNFHHPQRFCLGCLQ